MRSRLQHRIEYLLVRLVESVLAVLPPQLATRGGDLLGRMLRSPLRVRRSVVEGNLRLAFPDADDRWIDNVARESYRHLGREVVSMLGLSKLEPGSVDSLVEASDEDWAAMENALAEGRGVILATGHYGNWEMAAALVAARGVPIEAIVKRQSNPLVNARIEGARRALGIGTIDMGEAARRVPRALLSGKAVGIVADQDARHAGVWVPFFGVPASTHRGPALFALRLGSPLFAAVTHTLPDGRYRVSAKRIEVERTGSLEEDVARVTAEIARQLEDEIRKDPTQYFWFHKRWKTAPPEEPAPRLSGTTTHDADGP